MEKYKPLLEYFIRRRQGRCAAQVLQRFKELVYPHKPLKKVHRRDITGIKGRKVTFVVYDELNKT